MKSERLGNL